MAASPKFRLDVIFNTLRELQQEKELLEPQLNEAKARNKDLEARLEAAFAKCRQSNERNTRMTETVNVAKEKVKQTQSQAERLQELNNEKRGRITNLHRQIEEEEKRRDQEFMAFEKELSEMTEQFRNAKNYYKDENLQNEMVKWTKTFQESEFEVTSHEKAFQELCNEFENLQTEQRKVEENHQQKLEYGITPEELQSTIDVLEKMNQDTNELLEQGQKKLEEQGRKAAESTPKQKSNSSGQGTNVESCTEDSTPRQATLMLPSDSWGQISPTEHTAQRENARVPNQLHETSGLRLIDHRLPIEPVQRPVENTANKTGRPEVMELANPRKGEFQGRSFFISLPFAGSK